MFKDGEQFNRIFCYPTTYHGIPVDTSYYPNVQWDMSHSWHVLSVDVPDSQLDDIKGALIDKNFVIVSIVRFVCVEKHHITKYYDYVPI